jgi:hypothetical protein
MPFWVHTAQQQQQQQQPWQHVQMIGSLFFALLPNT